MLQAINRKIDKFFDWVFGAEVTISYDAINQRLDQIYKLNGEIKNLQVSIIIAKRQKKKTSHFYAEMAKLQAEVLRLEA